MSALDHLRTLRTELRAMARIAPHLPRLLATAAWSPARLLEERARELGAKPALLFEDRRYSWQEVDREVDRAAQAFRQMGVREGDVVALLMDNRPEFLFAITGLNRIRAGGEYSDDGRGGRGADPLPPARARQPPDEGRHDEC